MSPRGSAPRSTGGGLRHQEGFIRGAIVLFVIVTVVGMFILDILSVYTAHATLGDQTRNAANEAQVTFVQTGSEQDAQLAAASYLRAHDSTLVKITGDHTTGVYKVTAKRYAKTYFLHYLGKLPKMKGWIDRQLHPVVTGDNGL